MNLKKLFGTVLLLSFLFAMQSCTSDFETTEEDQKLEARIAKKAIAKKLYCRYNVTGSTTSSVGEGDIVCFGCTSPCADSINNKPYKITIKSSTGADSIITVGYVSGTGVSSSGACKDCPSDGKISS